MPHHNTSMTKHDPTHVDQVEHRPAGLAGLRGELGEERVVGIVRGLGPALCHAIISHRDKGAASVKILHEARRSDVTLKASYRRPARRWRP